MDRVVEIIGAPTDYGASRRGVDMGPSAIRYAGLADQIASADVASVDAGNVPVPPVEAEATVDERVHYLEATRRVTGHLADAVADSIGGGRLPLVLGGDHSVAIGTISGAARDASVGVLWLDAHGDFNTPSTSPSGNIHGMALAAVLGHGAFADEAWVASNLDDANVAWVGVRDLDPGERDRVRASDATAFTMTEVDRRGIGPVIDDALDVATAGVDHLHISLDLDWLEPTEAPGVGTPVPGGATYREAHYALERIAERARDDPRLGSIDIVEVNPILDNRNETAELAGELVASALGKRIL